MKVQKTKPDSVKVETGQYRLEIRLSDCTGRLEVAGTHQRYMFFPSGACNTMGGRDATLSFGRPEVTRGGSACVIAIPEKSSIWKKKEVFFVCREDSIEVYYTVAGKGQVERACFLRGFDRDRERGFAGDFDEIYSTEPNHHERLYFHPADSFMISFGESRSLADGTQALPSPCCCMGLHDRRDRTYVSVGIAARPGEYTWDAMEWNPPCVIPLTSYAPDNQLVGGFAAVYDGKLEVKGEWESPRFVISFARGQERVLPAFLDHCYARGYLPRPKARRPVAWWREPIYCTWHDQDALSALTGKPDEAAHRSAGEFCTQKLTDHWVRLLEKHHCRPGIVILDAYWQKHLNTHEPLAVWPDLRGWAEKCRKRGIRTFLWTAAWSKQGLPDDECITRDGQPVAADITNPAYEKRFRNMVRGWFSDAPGCLNCDGVKVDGSGSLPTGKGLKNYGNLWGLELQRRFLEVLYDEAKKHKPDVCISTCVSNPYLEGLSDMVRIADMFTSRLTSHETMLHRAEVYRQTMPYNVVDTDGEFRHYVLDDYVSELAEQAKVGAPTLYCSEWVFRYRWFQTRTVTRMTASDYKEIARVFAAYRKKIGSKVKG